MAPGVVHLKLQTVPEALLAVSLQSVVMAVRAGAELRHGAEPGIGGGVGERRKAALRTRSDSRSLALV
jgi:hypothetical protein